MKNPTSPLVSYRSETGLDIKLPENSGESHRGVLKYSPAISVELDNGITIVPDTKEDIHAIVEHENILTGTKSCIRRPLEKPVTILLSPFLSQRYRYFAHFHVGGKHIFPPSTNRFYSRIHAPDIENYYDDESTVSVTCSIHECIDFKDKVWLTISNSESGVIYEAFLIHQYECNFFSMVVDTHSDFALAKRRADGVDKSGLFDVEGFLEGSPPTWNQLASILQDISFPNLKIYDTLGETMLQLIPQVFPEIAQKSLCVFLGLLTLDRIESLDPEDVSIMFAPWSIIGSLYNSHLLYMMQNIKPPSYVRLMHLAARRQIQGNGRTIREDIDKSEWLMFWHLLHDRIKSFQDEIPILLDIVERTNQLGMITGKLIPSKSVGQRSYKAWVTRLVCNSSVTSPSLICTPNLQALGLQQALYLGSAYCWPHKHMSYITRLGGSFDNSPHLQRMILPPKASTRVKRLIPSLLNVTWSNMTFNSDLYSDRWNVRSEDILKSLSRTRSLTTLKKRYNTPPPCDVEYITPTEALVMDLITRSFHMMNFKERPHLFEKTFDIKKQLFIRTASSLIERGILKSQYILIPRLPTLATIVYGTPKKIISLADAFLSGSPTCTAYICNDGSNAIFLSRIPQSDLGELANKLPQVGTNAGLNIRCFRPHTLRSYNHTLYQRLLKDNGTWDEDVSGFLSQARAKRVEISSVLEREKMGECEV